MVHRCAQFACHMQEENLPVVGLWPAGFLMAEEPSMRVRGVDHIEVTPDEGTVRWRERKLGIFAFCITVCRTIAGVKLIVGTGNGEPGKRKKTKEPHGEV